MQRLATDSSIMGIGVSPEVPSDSLTGLGWMARKLRHEIIHELSAEPKDASIERSLMVGPSPVPTLVYIKSTIRAGGARALRSGPYLASARRYQAGKIAKLIASLPATAAKDDDFVAWVHEPLDRIRILIDKLSTAEEFREIEFEGNSCEILRHLRDTFLADGWQSYRQDGVCTAAVSVLNRLATQDEITSDDVYASLDTLLDAGLCPTIGIPPDDVDEEEEVLD
jgi:hypothetical protein